MLEVVQGHRRGLLLAPWFWRMLGRVPRRCHALPSERFTKVSVLASALVNVLGLIALKLLPHGATGLVAMFGCGLLATQLLHACVAFHHHAGRVPLSVDAPLRVRVAPDHVRIARGMFWLTVLTGLTLMPVYSRPMLDAMNFVQMMVFLVLLSPWFTARYFNRHPVLGAERAG